MDGGVVTEDTDVGVSEDLLIGGTVTTARPEVGWLSGRTTSLCTATLVAPTGSTDRPSRFVLTAAHCVGFRSGAEPDIRTDLQVHFGDQVFRSVRQRVWLSTGNPPNDDPWRARLRDVALLELERDVPLSTARPVAIGRTRPGRDEAVTLFGYGCIDRCNQSTSTPPVKRSASVAYGRITYNLCPGDSGGPTIDSRNQILRINSAFSNQTQSNAFADIVALAPDIESTVASWRTSPHVPPASRSPETSLTTCEACTGYGVDALGGGGRFWCPSTSSCYGTRALAESRCGTDTVIRYQGDCGRTDVIGEDVVGTYCATATDCRSCMSLYNCLWTDAGCVDSPDGTAPRGARSTLPRAYPFCCPGAVCDRDGRCERESGETRDNCAADCPTSPACDFDGVCEAAEGETAFECGADCPSAGGCDGDRICEPAQGEWCGGCGDCLCSTVCDGDSRCEPEQGETVRSCARDCPLRSQCDGDGRCEATEGETVTSCADCARAGFTDVATHPARAEIEALAAEGVLRGFGDGTFRPDTEVTRAQFAAIVVAAFAPTSTPAAISFSDVPASAWYRPVVAQAVAAGFMRGFPDGTFGPDQPITREQALVALDSGLGLSGGDAATLGATYTDASEIASWARAGVADAAARGALGNTALLAHGGDARRLRPRARATRGEIASFVQRLR